MTRFAIYARYSSDRQSERSIDDQIRLCRERIVKEGGSHTKSYTDYAISGGSVVNRPGIHTLMADAAAGRFDVLVAEALDRISRDQEDIAAVFKRLRHHGVAMLTLAEGEINELHIGLKGTMNALFLKDLAQKTRRGQRGSVEAGLTPGGLTYGYDMVRELDAKGELVRGKRAINPEQADVVRRIFREYVSGKSPRAIAADLNREGIPSPRGGHWNASTINGNRARRNGILHNELYIGFLIYNRQRFIKDPDTGKRVARPNPRDEWVVHEVPDLRIIDDRLWERAQGIKAQLRPEARTTTHRRRRPKRLLSGMLFCGCCGNGFTIVRPDRYGCSAYREKGVCDNKRTITAETLEKRVFDGLRDQLLHPEAVEAFIKEFHAELRRRRKEEAKRRTDSERKLREVTAKVDRIVNAIADGTDTPSMHGLLIDLERQKAEMASDLAEIEDPKVLDIHPNVAGVYRRKIENLEEALRAPGDARLQAMATLRTLVDKIVLYPGEKRGEMEIEIQGELAAVLHFAGGDPVPLEVSMLKLVAGAGFEPATFRL